MYVRIHSYTVWPECVNCANSPGYRSPYSDLLIDINRKTEWDRRQLWCKWRQLFVYIMWTLSGWWGCIIPAIVWYVAKQQWGSVMISLQWWTPAQRHCRLDPVWLCFNWPTPHHSVMLRRNVCPYLCGIVILAGCGRNDTGKTGGMHCAFESCGE